MKSSDKNRFDATLDRILSISRDKIQARVKAHRESAASNPKKRGPKGKRPTSSASPGPAV